MAALTHQQKWSRQCFFEVTISELIFNSRSRPVNWCIVVLEDEVLWWKVFGSNWPQIFLLYILIPWSIKISFYKCQSAMKYSPRPLFQTSSYAVCSLFRLPFFSAFSPNVDTFINPNLHFAFITKYNSVLIPNYRQLHGNQI